MPRRPNAVDRRDIDQPAAQRGPSAANDMAASDDIRAAMAITCRKEHRRRTELLRLSEGNGKLLVEQPLFKMRHAPPSVHPARGCRRDIAADRIAGLRPRKGRPSMRTDGRQVLLREDGSQGFGGMRERPVQRFQSRRDWKFHRREIEIARELQKAMRSLRADRDEVILIGEKGDRLRRVFGRLHAPAELLALIGTFGTRSDEDVLAPALQDLERLSGALGAAL
jgi:hypothetical protein